MGSASSHLAEQPARQDSTPPTAVLIGLVGAGKTTIFNKVCDANRQAEITDDSCTRQFVSKNVFYDGYAMTLYDGPGCGSTEDAYAHSFVLRHGLTHEPLNCIFVTVAYNPRIRNSMGTDFVGSAKILKPEYYDLITLVVTKMDQFVADANFPTRSTMEQHISSTFHTDYGMDRVVFSCSQTPAPVLFHALRAEAVKTPKKQLSYTDEEFMEYFDMKAWKGREKIALHRLEKQVEKLCAEFSEGLAHLIDGGAKFSQDEVQEYIYAMIQQNGMELESNIYDPFVKRHGDNAVEFDDYAACIEVQKLIRKAHEQFRGEAKIYLAVNPDDHADWRNSIRYCQYCGEVWVKVEGCDGETNCGALPSTGDPRASFSLYWERINGKLRPGKRPMKARSKTSQATVSSRGPNRIGCGRNIVWKNQAVVPQSKLASLFSPQELENILSSFKMGTKFRKLRNKKEREIQVWGELDDDGKDMEMEDAGPEYQDR